MCMETEIWKDIPGYEWYYQVSNHGKIRNIKWRILKQQVHHQWYLKLSLCVDYSKKTIKSHRLVALAFIKNPTWKKCVCHIDNNKQNNHSDNLYWGTHSENMKQAIHDWTLMWSFNKKNPHSLRSGSNSWFAKPVNQYDLNHNLVATYGSIVEAEAKTSISKQSISAVCRWVINRKTAWWFVWKFNI